MMSSVLCVTRNGDSGLHAQKKALKSGREKDYQMAFLDVIDKPYFNNKSLGVTKNYLVSSKSMSPFIIIRKLGENNYG